MISGLVSIRTVIAKVMRDLAINEELPIINLVEWSAEALNMIGAYSQFEEISDCLEIVAGKAKLPCNFYKLVSINYKGYPIHWATNTSASNYQCDGCKIPVCLNNMCEFTFYINDSFLITNIEKHNEFPQNVCMVYLGMPVDDEGFPMIPDDVYYMKAISAFITMMLDRQDWRKGKTTDKVYQESKAEWEFYVNSARASANMPNSAQLERLKNVWVRLMPLTNEYSRSFVNLGKQERRNVD